MMEVALWALMFFGVSFAGGFAGAAAAVTLIFYRRRKHTPTWANQEWRGL